MTYVFIDISQPLRSGMPVWPGDPPARITRTSDGLPSVSQLVLGTHVGTHVDPPAHFIAGAATVDRLPLDALIGPAWVAHLTRAGAITAATLEAADIPAGTDRLLLRTPNSDTASEVFDPAYVALTVDAAEWLLARKVRLVGIDAPSIELFGAAGEPVHHALLGAGVVIVEGLALADVPPGPYELICLPLRIADGDGAPARAILRAEGRSKKEY